MKRVYSCNAQRCGRVAFGGLVGGAKATLEARHGLHQTVEVPVFEGRYGVLPGVHRAPNTIQRCEPLQL